MRESYRSVNPEVLYSDAEPVVAVEHGDIDYLKQQALHNPRQRIRLCTHSGTDDRLHEMLIVHQRATYVRPHKHPGKTESVHIIEGLVDIVLFNEDGQVEGVLSMGDYASGKLFYYRMARPVFHTLLIRSEVLVFHEITNGPFDRSDTVFASWAPEEGDESAVTAFKAKVEQAAEGISSTREKHG